MNAFVKKNKSIVIILAIVVGVVLLSQIKIGRTSGFARMGTLSCDLASLENMCMENGRIWTRTNSACPGGSEYYLAGANDYPIDWPTTRLLIRNCPGGIGTTCSDSDGGKNYNTGGTTTDPRGEKTDTCFDTNIITEWYCEAGYYQSIMMTCSNPGSECALDSLGIAYCTSQQPLCDTCNTCDDTDSGDYFVKGVQTIRFVNWSGATQEVHMTDSCQFATHNDLTEYWCINATTGAGTVTTCKYGCSNGACIRSTFLQEYGLYIIIGGGVIVLIFILSRRRK
jgi:hypothetical protein